MIDAIIGGVAFLFILFLFAYLQYIAKIRAKTLPKDDDAIKQGTTPDA